MNNKTISFDIKNKWQIPDYEIAFWLGPKLKYCVVIPVINEGERIQKLLKRMFELCIHEIADIIIIDGGSNDGSLEIEFLSNLKIRGLLVKKGYGKLSAQLRCAYSFALKHGYDGIITIDGNNKDDPEAIPNFILKLDQGFDFIQGSRFIDGGVEENTPKLRKLAIRFIHAPALSFASGFKWTDTTQGFRAYSKNVLLDPRINPFRDIFIKYELLSYLSYRIPTLSFKCVEIPTSRKYPKGQVPSKINGIMGNINIFIVLLKTCLKFYNTKIR